MLTLVAKRAKQKTPLFLMSDKDVYNMYFIYSFREKTSFIAPMMAYGSNANAKTAVNKFNCGVLYGENHSVNNLDS